MHSQEVIIRRYQARDHEQVLTLHKEALVSVDAYMGEGPWDKDLIRIKTSYGIGRGVLLVAELQGRIIAMGAFRRVDDATAEIKRMRTLPSLQGLGIGTILLEKLLDLIQKENYTRVILEISARHLVAQKLYTRFGFKPFERQVIRGMSSTWYEKFLAD